MPKPDHYLFVVDTDMHAGYFERELCAYITGSFGEDQVGETEAQKAEEEALELTSELEKIIEFVPSRDNCLRPCEIFPNQNYGTNREGKAMKVTDVNKNQLTFPANTSVAIYFSSIPSPQAIKTMKERAITVASEGIGRHNVFPEIEGFRLLEQHTTYNELKMPSSN
ncbi:hypothetical protein HOE37_01460 [Candidatus Woesearchaeota archaeon]|jgi:hypothetical protein|nr:hypothetical protein [Candidatus Woesearchaeota archaeon]MBT4110504.1 hypothetical protein [Candidatus Woesearchaeota archaeon]MBT4335972.1 hypothetical protein [Candidatus Woesearchaeota archaeon]MBT4469049.1 hypothetical protein [Candidatus Woesearchaeota archaeon]MBT6744632.1 hypothetical protein [Candidatus Woesearchaeota archaeon]